MERGGSGVLGAHPEGWWQGCDDRKLRVLVLTMLKPGVNDRWMQGRPSSWGGCVEVALFCLALFFGTYLGPAGHCETPPPREFDFGRDAEIARKVSGLNLEWMASNRWNSAEEGRGGALGIRVALDKEEYDLGEPIHLFVYIWNGSDQLTALPKLLGSWDVHVSVLNGQNVLVPKTELGLWQDSQIPSGDFATFPFLSGQVKTFQLDVTEVVTMGEPGEYRVLPTVILSSMGGRGSMPGELNGASLGFKVTERQFSGPSVRSPSQLAAFRASRVSSPRPIPRQLTMGERAEVAEMNRLAASNILQETGGKLSLAPIVNPEIDSIASAGSADDSGKSFNYRKRLPIGMLGLGLALGHSRPTASKGIGWIQPC